jgi:hypothetical protein
VGSLLRSDRRAEGIELLSAIASGSDVDSRQTLQAWTFLRELGIVPPSVIAKQVFGAVAEVPMGRGHDVLAAYQDGSVRFLSHAGAATIVEDRTIASVEEPLREWLALAKDLVAQIGPWTERELPSLPADSLRVTVLTPSGPHFGQGPANDLTADPRASAFMEPATRLLLAVTAITSHG